MLSHGTSAHAPTRGLSTATKAEFAAAAWLAGYSNQLTRSSYAMHLRDWFQFCSEIDLDPLLADRVHVEMWLRTVEQRGLKPRTVSIKITTVRSFYAYCVDECGLEASPAARVKGPKIERRSPSGALNRIQVADLLAGARAIPHPHGPYPELLVLLLALNGLRIGETCAANLEDFSYVGFSPRLVLPNRKGGKRGKADLPRPTENLLAEIMAARSTGPLLLNQAGNRMTRSNAQRILTRAGANVRGFSGKIHPHLLRHSWVTIALDAGVDRGRLQRDGGWSDGRLVDYYGHQEDHPLAASTHSVTASVFSSAAA